MPRLLIVIVIFDMEKTVWTETFQHWKNYFYTEPLWLLCVLIALIFGLKNYHKEKTYKFFIIYLLSNLALFMIPSFFFKDLFHLTNIDYKILLEASNTFFALLEISIFFYFFKEIFLGKKIKTILIILLALFYLLSLIYLLTLKNVKQINVINVQPFSFYLTAVEFFFLLLFCIRYFHEILTEKINNTIQLSERPSFWIISGLFFYCIVSLPFLLATNLLQNNSPILYNIAGSTHYISISFLLICLTKAFTCKKVLTI